jgi:N-glycosidase YbiA
MVALFVRSSCCPEEASRIESKPMINNFKGAHAFLSNFFPQTIGFEGDNYSTVEHAYQAAKTLSEDERKWIREAKTPAEAKKRGRKVTMRFDWDEVKVEIMTLLVKRKFDEELVLRILLDATGDEELVEGNWWGDTFWGVCKGVGQNHLGFILMDIRRGYRL